MRASLAALLARVEEFGRERVPSTGGWAPVKPEEVSELAGILNDVIAAKYDPDPDGDLPINFQLVDRTRFERAHFFLIPYTHGAKTPAEYDAAIDEAMGNLKMAADKLNILFACRKELARRLSLRKA